MIRAYLAVLLLCIFGSTAAQQNAGSVDVKPQTDGSVVIVMPKQMVDKCNAEGGCAVLTKEALDQAILEALIRACGARL